MKQYSMISIICSLLLLAAGMTGCSSDENAALHGTWYIVGYGSDQDFHTNELIVHSSWISFRSNGTFHGHFYPNNSSGRYECDGNHFAFTEFGERTMMGAADPDLQFISRQLRIHFDYHITIVPDTEIRLYYDQDNYLKFYKQK